VKFSEQLAQGIPNAELVILDRGGHAFVVVSRNGGQEMLNFLAKHRKLTQDNTGYHVGLNAHS